MRKAAAQQMPSWKEKAFCLAEICKSRVFDNTNPQILHVLLETMSGKLKLLVSELFHDADVILLAGGVCDIVF